VRYTVLCFALLLVACEATQETVYEPTAVKIDTIENQEDAAGKQSAVTPETKPVKRQLPKNLAPGARKLVMTNSDEGTLVSISLEYASDKKRESIERSLVDLGVNIKAVQQETRNMSLETSSANLEAIADLDGVVYVDANSKLRR